MFRRPPVCPKRLCNAVLWEKKEEKNDNDTNVRGASFSWQPVGFFRVGMIFCREIMTGD
jgi:hypothetical protein